MKCSDVQEQVLVALQKREALSEELRNHLLSCKICCSVKKDLEVSFEGLNVLSEVKAPQKLSDHIQHQILGKLSHKRFFSFESLMPILFGLLATVVTFFLASINVDLSRRPFSEILISGLLWAISFSLAFHILTRKRGEKDNETSVLVRTGLFATGAFFLIDSTIPLSSVVDFCDVNG